MKNEVKVIRILESQEDRVLIVNCTQKSMPMWISRAELNSYSACKEDSISHSLPDFESLSPEQKRCAHERYTLIAGVLPFIGDEKFRCDAISRISSSRGISKQTIRNYLYRYLVYQNLSALAPKLKKQDEALTTDEKNIRWALNKFYYTRHKNSLNTAYTQMLKHKYCDASGTLLEILRKVDEHLDSKYYHTALKIKATVDMLIGSVSQVALNHIGLLVVDEIQNVANNKNGKSLIGALTQLINNSGISICMVGTPESAVFFEQAMQLARRSLGLQYSKLEYDQYFFDFCRTLYGYQYVKHKTEFSPAISEWLYEHSSGIISIVVSLIHDAQEIAILSGSEELNLQSLNEAYQKRLSLLHGYIQPTIKSAVSKPITKEAPIPISSSEIKSDFT